MASSLTVQAISEELGVHIDQSIDLNDVAKDAESFITSILELANRIRKHKSSKVLRVNDINDALSSRLARPLYGYGSNRPNRYQSAVIINNTEILVKEDKQIPLNLITSSSLKRYPVDTSFSFHWLAIDGVEPQIEENSCVSKVPGLISLPTNLIPEQTHFSDQRVVIINSKLMVSKELQIYFGKCLEVINKQASANSVSSNFNPDFKQLIENLSKDAAIQPLLKFFLKKITEIITACSSLMNLRIALSLAKGLFSNPNLQNELYLQTYVSYSTTIMISRYAFEDDSVSPQISFQKEMEKCFYIEQGLNLRSSAADFFGVIIRKYSDKYSRLQQRSCEFLTNIVFDGRINSISQYGALFGLMQIDLNIVRPVLIQSIESIINKIKSESRTKVTPSQRLLTVSLNNALLRLCAMCYKHDLANKMDENTIKITYSKVFSYFGNDFVAFTA